MTEVSLLQPRLLVFPMWEVSCQKVPLLLPPGVLTFNSCVMDFLPIFRGTPLGEVALIREPFFLLAAAWVGPGRSALQSAEQRCKGRYGRIHQVGKMSFYDKNMQKGRKKQHAKGGETRNHPQRVQGLQKRAPVMSEKL